MAGTSNSFYVQHPIVPTYLPYQFQLYFHEHEPNNVCGYTLIFYFFISTAVRLLKVAVREQCKGFIGSRLILAPKSTSQGESCEEVLWETLESRSFYKLSSMCQVCKKQGFSQLSDQLAQTYYNFMELFAKKTSISNIKTSWMMLELYVTCKKDSTLL